MEISKDLTAHAGKDIDKVATIAISEDTYVDDGATGGDEETVMRMIGDISINEDRSLSYSGTLSQIFEKGGFKLKMIVKLRETYPEALKNVGGGVLGHKWDPVQDTFTFSPKVFLGKKGRNGVYNGP